MAAALAALALVGVGVVLAFVPFTASGSAQHSTPLASWISGCPQDEGEAVADGNSQPGARRRCVDEARRRLLGAGALVVVTGIAVAGIAVATATTTAATVTAARSAAPADGAPRPS